MVSELDTWVRVALEVDAAEIDMHRELSRRESTQYRGRLDDECETTGDRVVLVGGIGDTIMGSLSAVETAGGHWQILHVYVVQAAREVGIGDRLLSTCLATLSARGADWCGATALPGDRSTKNLFERHGLVAQAIIVGTSLSGPSNEVAASR